MKSHLDHFCNGSKHSSCDHTADPDREISTYTKAELCFLPWFGMVTPSRCVRSFFGAGYFHREERKSQSPEASADLSGLQDDSGGGEGLRGDRLCCRCTYV